mmetsp:Transcript_3488/g.10554  ORF Transcript_3488/g.10554 Transcript_3488/m.10554 type:complete len:98 (+) Transcript_3488:556-849(+)
MKHDPPRQGDLHDTLAVARGGHSSNTVLAISAASNERGITDSARAFSRNSTSASGAGTVSGARKDDTAYCIVPIVVIRKNAPVSSMRFPVKKSFFAH